MRKFYRSYFLRAGKFPAAAAFTLLAALLSASALRASTIYTYRVIASSGDNPGGQTIDNFLNLSINDAGTVVFHTSNGNGEDLIATQYAVIAQRGSTVAGRILTGFSSNLYAGPVINEQGVVAFSASYLAASGHEYGIFSDGQQLAASSYNSLHIRAINSTGSVLYWDELAEKGTGLRTTRDGPVTPPGTMINGHEIHASSLADMNDADIAFVGYSENGQNEAGVFTQDRQIAGNIIDGKTLSTPINLRMSSSGNVAVDASPLPIFHTPWPPSHILSSDHVLVANRDVIDGIPVDGLLLQDVNDSGTIAFISGNYLFTQHGVVAGPGTMLNGHQVWSATRASMNNSGQIAFIASFGEWGAGGEMLVIADPTAATPESSTALLVPSALLLLGARWVIRRRSARI